MWNVCLPKTAACDPFIKGINWTRWNTSRNRCLFTKIIHHGEQQIGLWRIGLCVSRKENGRLRCQVSGWSVAIKGPRFIYFGIWWLMRRICYIKSQVLKSLRRALSVLIWLYRIYFHLSLFDLFKFLCARLTSLVDYRILRHFKEVLKSITASSSKRKLHPDAIKINRFRFPENKI